LPTPLSIPMTIIPLTIFSESPRRTRRARLRILFRDAPVEESDEDKPGVILDYDKDGNVVGVEVLNASQRVENPRGVDYMVTA